MTPILKSPLVILPLLVLLGCAKAESPKLTGVQPQYSAAQQQGLVTRDDSRPQLDILFVIDNSDSMIPKQNVLADNLNQFVNEFAKDNAIDFHIGVTSIFDSRRFGPVVKTFMPDGQLWPLMQPTTDPSQPRQPVANHVPYLDNSPGFADILKSTLQMGVIHLQENGVEMGPEFEELWTPIVAAFSEPNLSGANKGFYRPDAALAVIMVTDADDQSDMTTQEMSLFLRSLKSSPDKLSVFGVVIPSNLSQNQLSACADYLFHNSHKNPRDPYGAPAKIEALLADLGGKELNLCDQNGFGKQLADAGREVRRKAIQIQSIHLQQIPQFGKFNTIHVFSGTDEVAPGPNGWQFDAERNTVFVNPENPIVMKNQGQISIQYVPIHSGGTGVIEPHKVGTY